MQDTVIIKPVTDTGIADAIALFDTGNYFGLFTLVGAPLEINVRSRRHPPGSSRGPTVLLLTGTFIEYYYLIPTEVVAFYNLELRESMDDLSDYELVGTIIEGRHADLLRHADNTPIDTPVIHDWIFSQITSGREKEADFAVLRKWFSSNVITNIIKNLSHYESHMSWETTHGHPTRIEAYHPENTELYKEFRKGDYEDIIAKWETYADRLSNQVFAKASTGDYEYAEGANLGSLKDLLAQVVTVLESNPITHLTTAEEFDELFTSFMQPDFMFSIVGRGRVGDTLRVLVNTTFGARGTPEYQWFLDGEVIEDATESTLLLPLAYRGHAVSVKVSGLLNGEVAIPAKLSAQILVL